MGSTFLQCAVIAAGCLAGASASFAQFVVPTSYSATTGQTGTYTYFDETGSQLTDGVLGVNDWTVNLGSGNAYEWMGWWTVDPTLTFTFSTSQTIRSVLVGFNRGEGTGLIYLPTSVTIGGSNFSLTGTELPDQTRGFLQFDGIWTGTTLQIDLPHVNGRWVFVDEIKFSTTAIPEPAVTTLWCGLGALGLMVWRRRMAARNS